MVTVTPDMIKPDKGIVKVVVQTPSYAPIAGANVTLDSIGKTTDSQGEALFIDVTPKTYYLNVSKAGYKTAYRQITVQAGIVRTDQFNLEAEARPEPPADSRVKVPVTMTFTVLGDYDSNKDQKIAQAQVIIEDAYGVVAKGETRMTDPYTCDVSLTFPEGSYQVHAEHHAFYPSTKIAFTAVNGQTMTLKLGAWHTPDSPKDCIYDERLDYVPTQEPIPQPEKPPQPSLWEQIVSWFKELIE